MRRKIGVIGLGYVGLPVAVAFAKQFSVVGFDINPTRIAALQDGKDQTREVTPEMLQAAMLAVTHNPQDLADLDFYIVAVPTPIDESKQPDLQLLKSACNTISTYLKPGDIVVFESTVYPGVTEEVCLPLLAQGSGLVGGKDFFVGYSPERINPGDPEHRFANIAKVVSAQDLPTLEIVTQVYGQVIDADIYQASSIKVAEAAKVIENAQRDINIAFVNELVRIFHRMDIAVHEVLDAAATKWNFLNFRPGLVGGHCIGVDPFYLTHLAEKLNYHPEVMLSGRRINDGMGKFVTEWLVKAMIETGIVLSEVVVAVMGFTFKENCPDTRNTRVIDIIDELSSYHIKHQVYDPVAATDEVLENYRVELCSIDALAQADVAIMCVDHADFHQPNIIDLMSKMALVVDVKGGYRHLKHFKNLRVI